MGKLINIKTVLLEYFFVDLYYLLYEKMLFHIILFRYGITFVIFFSNFDLFGKVLLHREIFCEYGTLLLYEKKTFSDL